MFHQQEERGRQGRMCQGLPGDTGEPHGHRSRQYRGHDQGSDPRPGPGPRDFGRGHGRGQWRGGGWGFGHGPDHGMGRGPMVRRGDVRTAILALLAEEPMHGYQIIGQLGERSGGMWRPSAGSVYPTLQQLEDEGLVKGEERDGRNVYALTEDGRAAAARSAKSPAPWEMPGASEAADFRDLLFQLGAAMSQVSQVGSSEMLDRARTVLAEARRSLYRLLAEDDRSDSPTTGTGSAADPSESGDR